MRRVFGGHTSRDTEVARDVMRVPARAKESRDFSSEDDTSPVVVRRAHAMQVFKLFINTTYNTDSIDFSWDKVLKFNSQISNQCLLFLIHYLPPDSKQ